MSPPSVDLGNAYVDWQGVRPNIPEAVERFRKASEWLEKAMARDQPRAAHLLGICYQTGVGVPTDFEKAKELVEQAKRAGYTP